MESDPSSGDDRGRDPQQHRSIIKSSAALDEFLAGDFL